MDTTTFIYGVFTVIAILFAIGSLRNISDVDDLKFGIPLAIIFIIVAIILWKQTGKAYSNHQSILHTQYINNIQNKNYQSKLTTINGIYSDHITTDDGYYYLNEYSSIKDTNTFKPREDIRIYYVVDENDNKQIININLIKENNK